MKRKNILIAALYVLFLFLASCLHGQNLMNGTVKDANEKEALVGASIILRKINSDEIIDFHISDQSGGFDFPIIGDSIQLEIRMMGYRTIDTLFINSKPINSVVFYMQADEFDLEEIEVKAYKSGIIKNGDTLTYDPKNFTNGTEEDLKDLLSRVPGIEIDEDGRITANGKKIDEVLVEGDNFMNSSRRVLLESVRATDVENIQLINNYTERGGQVQNFAGSEKQALNIQLTDEAKSQWHGGLAIAGGVDEKWRAGSEAFRIGLKLKTFLTVKGTNTVQNLLTANDFFNLNGGIINFMRTSKNIRIEMPEIFRAENNYANNQSFFPNLSYSYLWNDKLKLNGYWMGYHSNNSINENRETFDADSNLLYTSEKISQGNYFMHSGSVKAEYQISDKSGFTLSSQYIDSQENNMLSDQNFSPQDTLKADDKSEAFDFSSISQLLFRHSVDDLKTLTGYVHVQYMKNEFRQTINSNNNIGYTDLLVGQYIDNVSQESAPNYLDLLSSVRYDMVINKWNTQSSLDYTVERQHLNQNASGQTSNAEWKAEVTNRIYRGNISIGRKWKGLNIRLGLTGRMKEVAIEMEPEGGAKLLNLLPEAAFTYKWPRGLRHLTLSYRKNAETYTLYYPPTALFFSDSRMLAAPLGNVLPDQINNGLSLFFLDFNLLQGFHLAFTLNYNHSNGQLGYASTFQNGYLTKQIRLIDGEQWMTSINAEKKLFELQSVVKMKVSLQYFRNPIFMDNRAVLQKFDNYHLNFSYSTLFEKNLNFEIKTDIRANKVLNEEQAPLRSSNISFFAQIIYKNSKNKVHIEYNPNQQKILNSIQWFHYLAFEVRRNLTSDFSLSLEAGNILNLLNGNQLEQINNRQFATEKIRYQDLSGFLLLNVKYMF